MDRAGSSVASLSVPAPGIAVIGDAVDITVAAATTAESGTAVGMDTVAVSAMRGPAVDLITGRPDMRAVDMLSPVVQPVDSMAVA